MVGRVDIAAKEAAREAFPVKVKGGRAKKTVTVPFATNTTAGTVKEPFITLSVEAPPSSEATISAAVGRL